MEQFSIIAEERLSVKLASLQESLNDLGVSVRSLLIPRDSVMQGPERRYALEKFVGSALVGGSKLLILSPDLFQVSQLVELEELGADFKIWIETPETLKKKYFKDRLPASRLLVNAFGEEVADPGMSTFRWWERDEDLVELEKLRVLPRRGVAYLGDLDSPSLRETYFALAKAPFDVNVYGRCAPDYLRLGLGRLDTIRDWTKLRSLPEAILLPKQRCDINLASHVAISSILCIPLFSLDNDLDHPCVQNLTVVQSIEDIAQWLESSDALSVQRGSIKHYLASNRAAQVLRLFQVDTDSTRRVDTLPVSTPKDPNCAVERRPISVALLGTGFDRPTSRATTLRRSLECVGHDVWEIDTANNPSLLKRDTLKVCQHQIDISSIVKGLSERNVQVLVACGINARFFNKSKELLQEKGIRTVFIDDSFSRWGAHLAQISLSYDLVFTPSVDRVRFAEAIGFSNVHYYPFFTNPDYLDALRDAPNCHDWIKLRRSVEREYELSPALAVDGSNVPDQNVHHFQHLLGVPLDELADKLRTDNLIMSHEGHAENPATHEIMPYALVAADRLFFPRDSEAESLKPYSTAGNLVGEIGELSKVRDREIVDIGASFKEEISNWGYWASALLNTPASRQDFGLVRHGVSHRIDITSEFTGSGPYKVRVESKELCRSGFRWQICILQGEQQSIEQSLGRPVEFLILNHAVGETVELEIKYLGPNLHAPWLPPNCVDVNVESLESRMSAKPSIGILSRMPRG